MVLSLTILSLWAAVSVFASPSPVHAHMDSSRDESVLITPELDARIAEILKNNTVPGYALAIVRLDDPRVEYGVWGNRTEDGDPISTDVCHPAYHLLPNSLSDGHNALDLVWHCIVLESFRCDVYGHSHGRLC